MQDVADNMQCRLKLACWSTQTGASAAARGLAPRRLRTSAENIESNTLLDMQHLFERSTTQHATSSSPTSKTRDGQEDCLFECFGSRPGQPSRRKGGGYQSVWPRRRRIALEHLMPINDSVIVHQLPRASKQQEAKQSTGSCATGGVKDALSSNVQPARLGPCRKGGRCARRGQGFDGLTANHDSSVIWVPDVAPTLEVLSRLRDLVCLACPTSRDEAAKPERGIWTPGNARSVFGTHIVADGGIITQGHGRTHGHLMISLSVAGSIDDTRGPPHPC